MKLLHTFAKQSLRSSGAASACFILVVASTVGVAATPANAQGARGEEKKAVPVSGTPCTLTPEQHKEVAAIRNRVADLEKESQLSDTRIAETKERIDQLSRELVKCLQPEIDRMAVQGKASKIPAENATEIQEAALRLATDLRMSPEERSRLIAKIQRDTRSINASTARELRQDTAAFERKLDGELGEALKALDAEKRKLQRLQH